MKYIGTRHHETRECGIRTHTPTGSGWPLDPRNDLFNHSPYGFEWGYLGSGPAQTALAILASHLADQGNHTYALAALGLRDLPPQGEMMGSEPHEYLAIRLHQRFKVKAIANLPEFEWELTDEGINKILLDMAQVQ